MTDAAPKKRISSIRRLDRSRGLAVPAVYAQLRDAIISREFEPGLTIREADVAAQLGVSRTPVREAIIRLAEERLVVIVPQLGTFVGRIDMRQVRNAQFIRESLEAAAVRRAATNPSRNMVLLRQLLASQHEALESGNVATFFQADEALHSAIFDLAGYPDLWDDIRAVKLQMDRLRRLSLPAPRALDELFEEHRAIVDAIDSGLADTGETWVRRHAQRVLDYAPKLQAQFPDYFTDADASASRR